MIRRRTMPLGFTLIEALAAIAIMVIVLPVILQGFSIASAIAERARQTTDATTIGQSHLDEMLALQQYDGINVQDTSNNVVYTTTSTEGSFEDEIDVNQVDITVSWLARGTVRSIKLTTLVFIPEYTSQTTPTIGGQP